MTAAKQQRKRDNKGRNMSDTGSTNRWGELLTVAALFILTILVYGRATENGLLNWDDNYYITESAYLKDLSWAGIKGIFAAYVVGNYHPITLLTYALEYKVAGRIDPALMHGTNVLLHAINAVLVFLFARRLMNDHAVGIITALVFALHPLHVESVAWIAERKDVLYTAFFLLSLIAYLRYARTGAWSAYAWALVFATLSLLSKSAAAVIGPVLFVLDYWLKPPWSLRLIWEKLPFLALALIFGLVALSSQAVAMEESFAPHFPLWQRPLVAGTALFFYLVRFAAPYGLSAMHPYPAQPGDDLAPFIGPAIGAFVIIAAILVVAYRTRTHWRITVTGLLFFLLTLALVLQLLPVGRAIVAERYTYVPYIGLALILAHVVMHAWRAVAGRSFMVQRLPMVGLALWLVVMTGITVKRIPVWKDSFTLFDNVLAQYPEDGLMYYNRGLTHYYARNYAASIRDYDASIQYKPDCVSCYYNRGLSYKEMGDLDAVMRDLDTAIRMKPDHTEALSNRGIAKAIRNDFTGSLQDFDRALVIVPNDTNVLMNRGLSRYYSEDAANACADWRRAVELGSRRSANLLRENCPD